MSAKNPAPSSNWAQLKKTIVQTSTSSPSSKPIKTEDSSKAGPSTKRRKLGGIGLFKNELHSSASTSSTIAVASSTKNATVEEPDNVSRPINVVFLPLPNENAGLNELRQMVAGHLYLNESRKAIGNYIAIDCEMVGLGHLGSESALARVSLVNYHGNVLLDTFVQPREKVTDYRTWVSGVREADILTAPSFDEVQKKVAEMIEGRVLIGHAIENDLKALLLSHPRPFVRDTQQYKTFREHAKTKRPGLKKLVELELGLKIQEGTHSSVTDARATMALYRLHKTEWEKSLYRVIEAYRAKTGTTAAGETSGKGKSKGKEANVKGTSLRSKRKREADDDDEEGGEEEGDDDDEVEKGNKRQYPGGGRKGISSGLSLIVRRFGKRVEAEEDRRRGPQSLHGGKKISKGIDGGGRGNWWEQMPS